MLNVYDIIHTFASCKAKKMHIYIHIVVHYDTELHLMHAFMLCLRYFAVNNFILSCVYLYYFL